MCKYYFQSLIDARTFYLDHHGFEDVEPHGTADQLPLSVHLLAVLETDTARPELAHG
jgi:hypothetical protein